MWLLVEALRKVHVYCCVSRSNYFHSGLTVASRLSDDPAVSVAVIEAGFNAEGLQEVGIES